MNAKANSIEIVPALIAARRTRRIVDTPVTSAALPRVVLAEDVVPSAEHHLRLALPSTDDRAGEFWETLSYAAIGICGLLGIGLCFL